MVPDPNGHPPNPSFPPITPVIPAPSSESVYRGYCMVSLSDHAVPESDGIHTPSMARTFNSPFPSHFNDPRVSWSDYLNTDSH